MKINVAKLSLFPKEISYFLNNLGIFQMEAERDRKQKCNQKNMLHHEVD